jgi:hypothetical protein
MAAVVEQEIGIVRQKCVIWSRGRELNPRPTDYESVALPLSYPGLSRTCGQRGVDFTTTVGFLGGFVPEIVQGGGRFVQPVRL